VIPLVRAISAEYAISAALHDSRLGKDSACPVAALTLMQSKCSVRDFRCKPGKQTWMPQDFEATDQKGNALVTLHFTRIPAPPLVCLGPGALPIAALVDPSHFGRASRDSPAIAVENRNLMHPRMVPAAFCRRLYFTCRNIPYNLSSCILFIDLGSP